MRDLTVLENRSVAGGDGIADSIGVKAPQRPPLPGSSPGGNSSITTNAQCDTVSISFLFFSFQSSICPPAPPPPPPPPPPADESKPPPAPPQPPKK